MEISELGVTKTTKVDISLIEDKLFYIRVYLNQKLTSEISFVGFSDVVGTAKEMKKEFDKYSNNVHLNPEIIKVKR